jgi:transposase
MNKALDEVRAEGGPAQAERGARSVLTKIPLVAPQTQRESPRRAALPTARDLLRYNLKTVRAYLLKEAFQQLWDYNSPAWAGKFLDEWRRQTMRSRIEPMKKIARSLREHGDLILN